MSTFFPAAPFSMGASTNVAPIAATGSIVDMSLDDLIAARRKEEAAAKKVAAEQKRTPVKGVLRSNSKSPTNVQRSVGSNQAKRKAAVAARRGITESIRPTPMQVDKEVYRQQRKGSGPSGGGNKPVAPQQPNGISTGAGLARKRRNRKPAGGHAKTLADQKVKAKIIAEKKINRANQTMSGQRVQAPTKKAVNAAVSAMNEAGYKVPKGMQMVISFAPAPGGAGQEKSNNPTPKKPHQNNRSGGDQPKAANQQQHTPKTPGTAKKNNNRNTSVRQ